MQIINTNFNDVKLIKKELFIDDRGYFTEVYHQKKIIEKICKNIDFVQENESCSKKNTIRGLHYQIYPFAQTKLINIMSGGILDVIVDLRKNSPTFLKHIKLIVRAEDNMQLFIPRGFAHGFIALEDFTKVTYMVDNFYNPMSERGILYSDPQLKIDWGIDDSEILISNKDRCLPTLEHVRDFFEYDIDYYG